MNHKAGIGLSVAAIVALVLGVFMVSPLLDGKTGRDVALPDKVTPAQRVSGGTVLKAADACTQPVTGPVAGPVAGPAAGPVAGPFVPTSIRVQDVTKSSRVLALPRDGQNVPGVPAISDKSSFAWDAPGIKPGSPRGNVLLNAHTWPNGTAMGNFLLEGLGKGEIIELSNGKRHLCYRVTERLEASIENPPLERVYDFTGKPQAVLIVCSGVRRGPGDWSHRTIWFAEPVNAA